MAGALTDDQRAIRDGTRDYLTAEAGFERLHAAIDGPAGWDRALWRGFATEMGFSGIAVPERFGGLGQGFLELALVAEELGRTLAPIPWFETAVLAARAIAEAGDEAQCERLLGNIARGEIAATLAFRSEAAPPLPEGIGPRLSRAERGWRLTGAAHYVPFGHAADVLVIAARHEDGEGWDGISLLALDSGTQGVSLERLVSLDRTRPLAGIRFDDVAVPDEALLGPAGAAGPALRRVLAVGAALLAAEQVGGIARSLEETVNYAGQRVQFGRLIGSFQAVKHRLADMKVALEAARSASAWALEALEAGGEMFTVASAVRAECSDAYLAVAGDAIQLHGGIGFTWEHHAHLFFKRARSSATLLDPPTRHRELVAEAILDSAASSLERTA